MAVHSAAGRRGATFPVADVTERKPWVRPRACRQYLQAMELLGLAGAVSVVDAWRLGMRFRRLGDRLRPRWLRQQ